MREKATTSDQKVKKFLLDTGLIDTGAQLSLEEQLKELSSAVAKIQIRVIQAQARSTALTKMRRNRMLDSAPEILSSSTIQFLRKSQAKTVGRPNMLISHDRTIRLQIKKEAERIVRGAKVKASNLLKQKRMLDKEIGLIRQRLTQRSSHKLELDQLKHEALTDKTVMDVAMKRMKGQVGFSKFLNADLEIISRPEIPSKPIFPNPLLTLPGRSVLCHICWHSLDVALSTNPCPSLYIGLIAHAAKIKSPHPVFLVDGDPSGDLLDRIAGSFSIAWKYSLFIALSSAGLIWCRPCDAQGHKGQYKRIDRAPGFCPYCPQHKFPTSRCRRGWSQYANRPQATDLGRPAGLVGL